MTGLDKMPVEDEEEGEEEGEDALLKVRVWETGTAGSFVQILKAEEAVTLAVPKVCRRVRKKKGEVHVEGTEWRARDRGVVVRSASGE